MAFRFGLFFAVGLAVLVHSVEGSRRILGANRRGQQKQLEHPDLPLGGESLLEVSDQVKQVQTDTLQSPEHAATSGAESAAAGHAPNRNFTSSLAQIAVNATPHVHAGGKGESRTHSSLTQIAVNATPPREHAGEKTETHPHSSLAQIAVNATDTHGGKHETGKKAPLAHHGGSSLLELSWWGHSQDPSEGPTKIGPEQAMETLLKSGLPGASGSCFYDDFQAPVGCRASCWCDLWQQCFPHQISVKDGRASGNEMIHVDVGVCHVSMEILAVGSLLLIFISLGLVVIARMILQFVEEKAEKSRQATTSERRPNPAVVKISTQGPRVRATPGS